MEVTVEAGAEMIIDLRELIDSSGRIEGDVETRVDDPMGGEFNVPCRVAVEYRQSQGALYLHGRVDGDIDTSCHRCLDPVTAHVAGEFDLIVRRGAHEGGEGDDVIVLAPHEHEVRLEPIVHETVVLNSPMIVACRDDCRGLCPSCGTNLNTGACTCAPAVDARWDALRGMKQE